MYKLSYIHIRFAFTAAYIRTRIVYRHACKPHVVVFWVSLHRGSGSNTLLSQSLWQDSNPNPFLVITLSTDEVVPRLEDGSTENFPGKTMKIQTDIEHEDKLTNAQYFDTRPTYLHP